MLKRDELLHGCMAKAKDDEITFVLLGRDVSAPATIRFWCEQRVRCGKNTWDDKQITEALMCAEHMETWLAITNND